VSEDNYTAGNQNVLTEIYFNYYRPCIFSGQDGAAAHLSPSLDPPVIMSTPTAPQTQSNFAPLPSWVSEAHQPWKQRYHVSLVLTILWSVGGGGGDRPLPKTIMAGLAPLGSTNGLVKWWSITAGQYNRHGRWMDRLSYRWHWMEISRIWSLAK